MRTSGKILWIVIGAAVLAMAAVMVAGRIAVGWSFVPEADGASRHPRRRDRGPVESMSPDLSGFDGILVEGEWTVDVRQAGGHAVDISFPDAMSDWIVVETEGRTLVLSCVVPDCTDSGLEAHIGMPSLAGITVSGAADIGISGFHEDRVDFVVEGAANIIAEDSSAGRVSVRLDGIGNVDLSDMTAEDARVDIGGAGWVKLAMDGGVLEGSLDGMGRIYYSGDVSAERVTIDGLGKVKRK